MVTSESTQIDRTRPERISSVQLKAMRDVKPPSLFDHVCRVLTNFWSGVGSGIGYLLSPKQSKKSFCEMNGHSVKMVNGTVTNQCRFCSAEIDNVEMLHSR
jgi:hypothetical protein